MKRMKKKSGKSVLSFILCLSMLMPRVSLTILGEEGSQEYHTEHTADCGYVEAVEGQPCTQGHSAEEQHDDTCGYVAAVAGSPCRYESGEEITGETEETVTEELEEEVTEETEETVIEEPEEEVTEETEETVTEEPEEEVTEETGEPVTEEPEEGVAGETEETTEETEEPEEVIEETEETVTEKPEEEVTKETEETVIEETTTEEVEEAAEEITTEAVRAMVAELPSSVELYGMSMKEQKRAYAQVQKVCDVFEALTQQQKEKLAEEKVKLEALLEWWNTPISVEERACEVDGCTGVYQNGICDVCGRSFYTLELADGSIVLKQEDDVLYYMQGDMGYVAYAGVLTVMGESDTAVITIENGDHKVIFDTVSMTTKSDVPLYVAQGSLELTLLGENLLGEGSYEQQSILLDADTTLTITEEASGTLFLDNGKPDHDNYGSSECLASTRDLIDGEGSLVVDGGIIQAKNGGGIGIAGDLTVNGGSIGAGFVSAKNVSITGGTVKIEGEAGKNKLIEADLGASKEPFTTHGIFAQETISISGGYTEVLTGGPACQYMIADEKIVTDSCTESHALYAQKEVLISGGTVVAVAESYEYVLNELGAWEISSEEEESADLTGYGIYSEKIQITGGNVKAAGLQPMNTVPTNGSEPVVLYTVTLEGEYVTEQMTGMQLTDIDYYGMEDVYLLDDNKLYLYLPENAALTEIIADDQSYVGTIADGAGIFTHMDIEKVATASVTWPCMQFTCVDGDWDPETQSYDVIWQAAIEGGDVITVTNTGNVKAKVIFSYDVSETGILGSFTNESLTLEVGETGTTVIQLSGRPNGELENQDSLGTITVIVEEAEDDGPDNAND